MGVHRRGRGYECAGCSCVRMTSRTGTVGGVGGTVGWR